MGKIEKSLPKDLKKIEADLPILFKKLTVKKMVNNENIVRFPTSTSFTCYNSGYSSCYNFYKSITQIGYEKEEIS